MTTQLEEQRRWAAIADGLRIPGYLIDAVIMPPSEGGGILVVIGDDAYHFFTQGQMVCYDRQDADSPPQDEASHIGPLAICDFNHPPSEVAKSVTEVIEDDLNQTL